MFQEYEFILKKGVQRNVKSIQDKCGRPPIIRKAVGSNTSNSGQQPLFFVLLV